MNEDVKREDGRPIAKLMEGNSGSADRRPAGWKRAALILIGWIFVLLGTAGLFLPFLQGILFLAIGLFILSYEYAWAKRLLLRMRTRYPRVASYIDAARRRIQRL
jgi:Putative transmembrane protein (PGPGW)